MDRESLEKVAWMFSAFSDATRLAIIMELKQGPLTVGELVARTEVSQGNAYINSIYGNTTSVSPIEWIEGSQTDLFAAWDMKSPFDPLSSRVLTQKFGIC